MKLYETFLKSRSKNDRLYQIVAVFFFALVSLGAWWGGNKAQKEIQKDKTQQLKLSAMPQNSVATSEKGPSKSGDVKAPIPQNESTVKKDKDAQGIPVVMVPVKQQEEVEAIKGELKEIIVRTRQLQDQVKNNRSDIQHILERAQIHQQILRNITLPPPVIAKQQIDPEVIVRREKLRIIAEQAKQTQEQLRIIQQARSLNRPTQITPTSTDTKTSKTS